MGRRGPKPEPAAVKKQKGSSRRPVGEDPSATEQAANTKTAAKIAAPAWLKGEGLKVWNRLVPQLIAQKLLTRIDAETFGRYCKNFARWLKMQKVLDNEGETYESESPHGSYKRAHPAYMIADRLEKQLASAEANFGLNPAERQRLFAARAAGSVGDLFSGSKPQPEQKSAPSTEPPMPATDGNSIGLLN